MAEKTTWVEYYIYVRNAQGEMEPWSGAWFKKRDAFECMKAANNTSPHTEFFLVKNTCVVLNKRKGF